MRRLPILALAVVGAVLATVATGGCNIVAPVAFIIEGPPTVEAQYELPDVPTVVFVDDRANVLPRTGLRFLVGDTAAETLLREEILTTAISSRDAINLARVQETGQKLMSIDAIGEAVGADTVIYVKILGFAMTDDGLTPRPTAAAEVRVIDVLNDTRLWPPASEPGHMLQASLSPVNPDLVRSPAAVRQIEDALAAKLGDEIAKLFYEHEPRPLGERTG